MKTREHVTEHVLTTPLLLSYQKCEAHGKYIFILLVEGDVIEG